MVEVLVVVIMVGVLAVISGAGCAAMVIESVPFAVPPALVAVRTQTVSPSAVGTPLITRVAASNTSPAGSGLAV